MFRISSFARRVLAGVSAAVLLTMAPAPLSAGADGTVFASLPGNLAQGKTAYASSNARGSTAGIGARTVRFLTDGSTDNFIVTHPEDADPWFYVDLGESTAINQVKLLWGGTDDTYQNAYATAYRLEVSESGLDNEWQTVYTVTDGAREDRTLLFDSVSARYVRVSVDARAGQYAALREMYVYGTDFEHRRGETETLKVLFIGNSHTYMNDVPGIVRDLMVASGRTIEYQEITAGGMSLEWHSQQPATLETIRKGHFDYVILQEKASGFDAAAFRRGVTALNAVIGETDATPLLYMIWSNESLPLVQRDITTAYVQQAQAIGARLAAAGVAWDTLRHGDPPMALYADGNHAKPVGSYLAACSIFYALTDVDEVAVVADGDPLAQRLGITVADANLMQRTAYKVTEHGYEVEPLLWTPGAAAEKKALTAALNTATQQTVIGYTAESVEALTAAMQQAAAVRDNADASQEAVDAAVLALNAALDGLKPLPGDVDGDGEVTTTDARLSLQYAVEKIDHTVLRADAADVDGNGKVDTTDARRILQYAAEKIDKF